jgi:hypothetical protein
MEPSASPFFSRTYGGFSDEQVEFMRACVDSLRDGTVVDPMAGQGFFLSQTPPLNSRVYLGDINPGALALATLRDPVLLKSQRLLTTWFTDKIQQLDKGDPLFQPNYCIDWIPPGIRRGLDDYVKIFGLRSLGDPMKSSAKFWRSSPKTRFAAALPLLAARDLVSYTESDNITWLKRGGLQRHASLFQPLVTALKKWSEYAQQRTEGDQTAYELHCSPMDPSRGLFGSCPPADLIVTSPPYANRLDYSRMWAPELNVLATMFGFDPAPVKFQQIGTTVVKGKKPQGSDTSRLPAFMRRTLRRIRDDELAKASESYYYPFFANYAVALFDTFSNIADQLRSGGTAIVFVRDTTRKDTLFEAGKLVESSFRARNCIRLAKNEVLIRRHVGMMRRGSPASMYGLAQREWWLIFRKPK